MDRIISQGVWNHLESIYLWFASSGYNDKIFVATNWIFPACVSKLKSLKCLSIRKHKDAENCSDLVCSGHLSSGLTSTALPYHYVSLTTICMHGLGNFLSRLPNVQTLSLVARLTTYSYPIMIRLHRCKLKLLEPSFKSI